MRLSRVRPNAVCSVSNRKLCADLFSRIINNREEDIMGSAWQGLLGTDYGLFSLIGSIFMLGIGVFFIWFFSRKIQQSTDEHARELREGGNKPPVNNGHG
jgi:hypothetical protein